MNGFLDKLRVKLKLFIFELLSEEVFSEDALNDRLLEVRLFSYNPSISYHSQRPAARLQITTSQ